MTLTDIDVKNILSSFFIKRDDNLHKGAFGNSLVIGGSKNYIGAPMFSVCSIEQMISILAESCMRVGSGLSSILVPDFLHETMYQNVKYSAIYSCKSNNGAIAFDKEILDKLLKKATSVSIGMGMGNGDSLTIVKYILESSKANIVIDADALVCKDLDFNNRCILTPHLREFSQMINKSVDEINENPIELAKAYAKEHNCILVLKSSRSIITNGKDYYINHVGNAKLSKGGSGDILSGIICGLSSYSSDLFKNAIVGSYILGSISEKCLMNEYSCLPFDLIPLIPEVISDIQNNIFNI